MEYNEDDVIDYVIFSETDNSLYFIGFTNDGRNADKIAVSDVLSDYMNNRESPDDPLHMDYIAFPSDEAYWGYHYYYSGFEASNTYCVTSLHDSRFNENNRKFVILKDNNKSEMEDTHHYELVQFAFSKEDADYLAFWWIKNYVGGEHTFITSKNLDSNNGIRYSYSSDEECGSIICLRID